MSFHAYCLKFVFKMKISAWYKMRIIHCIENRYLLRFLNMNYIFTWWYSLMKMLTTFSYFQSPLPFATCPNETIPYLNMTLPVEECELSSETAYFWYRQTIDASPSISETGGVKWWMALSLTLSWLLVWLCIMKGIQSSGKVRLLACYRKLGIM